MNIREANPEATWIQSNIHDGAFYENTQPL